MEGYIKIEKKISTFQNFPIFRKIWYIVRKHQVHCGSRQNAQKMAGYRNFRQFRADCRKISYKVRKHIVHWITRQNTQNLEKILLPNFRNIWCIVRKHKQ